MAPTSLHITPPTPLLDTAPPTYLLHSPHPPTLRAGSFDRFLNVQITLVIFLQIAMALFLSIASYIWKVTEGQKHYYLALTVNVQVGRQAVVLGGGLCCDCGGVGVDVVCVGCGTRLRGKCGSGQRWGCVIGGHLSGLQCAFAAAAPGAGEARCPVWVGVQSMVEDQVLGARALR